MKATNSFDQLLSALDQDSAVADFQLFSYDSTALRAGSTQDQLGMIYRPVQKHLNSGIKYLVVLADGRVAQGTLGAARLQDITGLVAFMKSSATQLATPAQLAPVPEHFTPTQLADQPLTDIIDHQPEQITALAKSFMQSQLAYGLESIEGEVELKKRSLRFVGSHGLDMQSQETTSDFAVEYNAQIGVIKHAVGMVTEAELAKTAKIAEYAKALKLPSAKLLPGNYTMVFEPYNGFGVLDEFVLGNINGTSVEAGVARFGADDFSAHKQIGHANLNFAVDQTLPMETESFNFTSEGIVGQRFEVIKDGQLTEPICNLQTAKQLGVSPRSLRSFSTAQLTGTAYDDFVAAHPNFILVLSVLGTHTQNSVLGNYSLPCPSALYFEHGKLVGPVNCVITGDFFAKLMDPKFGFVQLDAYEKPSLCFESDVTFKTA